MYPQGHSQNQVPHQGPGQGVYGGGDARQHQQAGNAAIHNNQFTTTPAGSAPQQLAGQMAEMHVDAPRRKHKTQRVYDTSYNADSSSQSAGADSQMPVQPAERATAAEQESVAVKLDQLPSVPEERTADQERLKSQPFQSYIFKESLLPRATSDFIAVDEGNSTPKFIRSTTSCIPSSNEVLAATGVPLAVLVQPFAEQRPEEMPVPLVDTGPGGPPRCTRCRTYINPFMQFVNGGSKVVCNHCLFASDVPDDYYAAADNHGRRQDHELRPELLYGTVDFLVPKEYWFHADKEPVTARHIFAIDVSEDSYRRGLPKDACKAILDTLYVDNEPNLPKGSKVAIMTFDRALHFYNLSPLTEQVSMLVVADFEEPFVPLSDGLFVDPEESKTQITTLLQNIEGYFSSIKLHEPALGAAIESVTSALENMGGHLSVFLSALPTWGPGALRFREQAQLYGSENEKSLFIPQHIYWNNLGEKCVDYGIGVDLFLFPSAYMDIASLGTVSSMTGGEVFTYFNYLSERDSSKLSQDLRRSIIRERGSQALMALRCSNGLRVNQYYGNFHQRRPQDIQFGNIDADKGVVAVIRHDGKLDEKLNAHFQSAVLYTSPDGQRRVRCHNYAARVSSSVVDIIKGTDTDALLAYMARKAVSDAIEKPLRNVRDGMTELCVKILASYRKACGNSSNAGQMILPESLKTLPVLVLCLCKFKAFRSGHISSDVRTHNMRLIRGISAKGLSLLIYPQIFSLHNMHEEDGFPDEYNLLCMPPACRATATRLEQGGAYLVNNGQMLLLFLHSSVSPNFLVDLFGPEYQRLQDLDPRDNSLPIVNTRLSVQVRNTIACLNQHYSCKHLAPQKARQSIDGSEQEFAACLVEDRTSDSPGYKDYLAEIHRQIQQEASGSRGKSDEGFDFSGLWQGRF